MSRIPALALVATLVFASAATAAPIVTGDRTLGVALTEVLDGFEGAADVLFHLSEAGSFYAKVLPTPSNAVHDGSSANGTTTADHASGLTGWWVEFALLTPAREPATDATGAPIPSPLGVHADDRPTPLVPLAADEEYVMRITVHAPDGGVRGGAQKVYVVLASRAGDASAGWSSSGASLDESTSVTMLVSGEVRDLPPPPPPPGGGGSPHTPPPVTPLPPPSPPGATPSTPPSPPSPPGSPPSPSPSPPVGPGDDPGAGDGPIFGDGADARFAWMMAFMAAVQLVALCVLSTLAFLVWRELRLGRGAAPRGGPSWRGSRRR